MTDGSSPSYSRSLQENLPLDAKHEGLAAVIDIAGGDMRKCLNIMQACKAAYGRLDEAAVYQCTGAPSPKVVRALCADLLNMPLAAAFARVLEVQVEKGLSLVDLVTSLHDVILRLSLHPKALAFVLPRLAEMEKALSSGANERLQLGALVSAFVVMREITVREMQ